MTGKDLFILNSSDPTLVRDCVAGHGFAAKVQITQEWRSHFAAHAVKHPALLANPSALLDQQINSTLVLNGPNLNMLGTREPEIYGSDTLADITRRCLAISESSPCTLEFRQSNHEGEIVTWIQEAAEIDALIINAGAYTHTSVAIHDALKSYPGIIVELHISNPHQRESFRHHSFVTATADSAAIGLGTVGYDLIVELICSEADAH